MKRYIDSELERWRAKSTKDRCPLIVRGARQVGKSHSIEDFGRRCFSNSVTVNFEFEPALKACFASPDPQRVVSQLELKLNQAIHPGETLLFLDEIQECPPAIKTLRYFKEKMPELHVVAAGSLLEFILEDAQFSFPVGRVEFMYQQPLSFIEFLWALGVGERIEDRLEKVSLQNGLESVVHEMLVPLVKKYCLVGGMPISVLRYRDSGTYSDSQTAQRSLLVGYESDFGKYARKAQHKKLRTLLQRAPDLVGSHTKYSKIDPTSTNPSRDYSSVVDQLEHAGLIYRVRATAANGVPLRAEVNPKKFKLLFLDVGLYQCAMEIGSQILAEDITGVHNGALAEQFVGQELLALDGVHVRKSLYFWERSKATSSAEVDYVKDIHNSVVPIEVKAGKTGRLRSLQQFLSTKNSPIGVRISELPLSLDGDILSVPFYLIHRLPDLLTEALKIRKKSRS